MKKEEMSGEFELEELRHKNRMEEIEFEKKNEAQKFDHMMQIHRLKRADISRSQLRRDFNHATHP